VNVLLCFWWLPSLHRIFLMCGRYTIQDYKSQSFIL
jgi:hypothetical protein